MAENLSPVLSSGFADLPENEVTAALHAVRDAFAEINLSDEAFLADDANPEKLAQRVRSECPDQPRAAGLSESGTRLYQVALDQACRYLVRVLLHLPAFQPHALAEVLDRLSTQSGQLAELLARTPKTTLYAPHGTDHDAEFTEVYLRHLASTLDRLHLLGLSTREQPKEFPLSVAYLSLTVTAKLGARGRHRQGFENEDGRDISARVRIETAISGSQRTLIRGEAGSGKTISFSEQQSPRNRRTWTQCDDQKSANRGEPRPAENRHHIGSIVGHWADMIARACGLTRLRMTRC